MRIARMLCVLWAGTAALLLVANSAEADGALVDVGGVDQTGTVQLDRDKFRDRFPDGMLITEIAVTESNGSLRVVRKGTGGPKICVHQSAPLYTQVGTQAIFGTLQPGDRVFMRELVASQLSTCRDSGCNDSGNARCRISEESGNKCRCHVGGPFPFISTNTDLCTSIFEVSYGHISEWIVAI